MSLYWTLNIIYYISIYFSIKYKVILYIIVQSTIVPLVLCHLICAYQTQRVCEFSYLGSEEVNNFCLRAFHLEWLGGPPGHWADGLQLGPSVCDCPSRFVGVCAAGVHDNADCIHCSHSC